MQSTYAETTLISYHTSSLVMVIVGAMKMAYTPASTTHMMFVIVMSVELRLRITLSPVILIHW